MMKLLLTLSLTFCLLVTFGESSVCDSRIINLIYQKFWNNGRCTPTELLRNGAYMSPGSAVRTTKDFYANDENLPSNYAVYCGSTINVYTPYQNCTSSQSNAASMEPSIKLLITEQNGVLIDTTQGIYFYHLYTNRLGVTAFYRCYTTGGCGNPEGLIFVSARGYDAQAVAEAVEDLACLGIYVSDKVFNVTSATQSSCSNTNMCT